MVTRETQCRSTVSLTRLWILTLEPERLKNRRPPPEMNLGWKALDRRSSCLLFQMFGVETHSFLPDQQSDRRNLARQGQARHRRLHSSGHQSGVELLQRSGDGSGSGGRTLEDIFQIVIVIAVEPADRQEFLRAFELSLHEAVFAAAGGLQSQTAVGPELPLGAKAMRRLNQSNQQSRPDRTDRRNLAQQFIALCFRLSANRSCRTC